MTKTNQITKLTRRINKEFDTEYIGGVGFCGARWQEAQAEYNNHKDAAMEADTAASMAKMGVAA